MWETRVQSLGWQDPLEKEMTTHSSILAWRIPWTKEPAGHSPWGHKELDTTERLSTVHTLYYKPPHEVFDMVDLQPSSCTSPVAQW